MKKNTQLIWGLATIVGVVVFILWFFRLFRRLLFWLRYQLIPGLILLAIVLGIIYLAWAIFFKKDES